MILTNIYELPNFWWGIGIIAYLIIYALESKHFNLKWYNSLLIALINLIILALGAKTLYIIENLDYVLKAGIHFGGFSLYGAIFIMPLAFYINHLIFKKSFLSLGAEAIIPLVVMLGFYRFDCLKNGCCRGIVINGYRFPNQLVEAISCFIMALTFAYFTFYKNKDKGECFIYFYLIYGLLRFILEFLREREYLFLNLSISHIWSFISIIIGVVLIYMHNKNRKKI